MQGGAKRRGERRERERGKRGGGGHQAPGVHGIFETEKNVQRTAAAAALLLEKRDGEVRSRGEGGMQSTGSSLTSLIEIGRYKLAKAMSVEHRRSTEHVRDRAIMPEA
jgi:hypothetical protein